MSIRLENIAKHFANTQALEPIDLDIHEGELVGLLGPLGRARRPCCVSLRGWRALTAGQRPARFCLAIAMSPMCTCVTGASVLSFSTMRCFAT